MESSPAVDLSLSSAASLEEAGTSQRDHRRGLDLYVAAYHGDADAVKVELSSWAAREPNPHPSPNPNPNGHPTPKPKPNPYP